MSIMPHPCSAKGGQGKTDCHRGGMCVGKRTVANPVYYNGDMQKREGCGYSLALNGHGATPGQVMMRVI